MRFPRNIAFTLSPRALSIVLLYLWNHHAGAIP